MSVLRKGGTRRAAIATVVSLGAFQALAIVGALPASAILNPNDCNYNASNDTVTIQMEDSENATIGVVDPGDEIQITETDGTLAAPVDCGSATTANTVAVVVLGSGAVVGDESFTIDNDVDGSFGAIAFSIDMGNGTADTVIWEGTTGNDTVAITNDTFTTNGGVGEVVGTEFVEFFGNDGDDVLDGSGTTSRVLDLHGQDGDDTVTGGGGNDTAVDGGPGDDLLNGGNGNDSINGGPDDDFVDEGTAPNGADTIFGNTGTGDEISYAGRTGNVNVSMNTVVADADDGEGCVDDTVTAGCEGDDDWAFEIIATGSGADHIEGDETAVNDETMIGNANDDVMDGNSGGGDVASWRDSAGPITVDTFAGTATGDGNDSWTETEGVEGSGSADDLLNFANETGPITANLCTGAVTATTFDFVTGVDLSTVNCSSSFENLTGSPGNDLLTGDIDQNDIDGGDGNDVMNGGNGNDVLIGRAGNDTYTGGLGADTANFKFAPNGVTVDVSLGFATGEGDDTLGAFGDIEIIVGSDFNDNITGGLSTGGGSVNFRFKGRGGADSLTGSASNDTLLGGGGSDILRSGQGDDTLKGAGGNDTLSGGGGFDIGNGGKGKDTCSSIEQKKSCGKKGHPAAPQAVLGTLD